MDQLLTVTQVSRACGVSARMLRYYEKQGLIASRRMENYAYRAYTPEDIARLASILALRKLRIPLKDIAVILEEKNSARIREVFRRHIEAVDRETAALSMIRGILQRLEAQAAEPVLLTPELIALTDALSPSRTNLKEEGHMSELNSASRILDEHISVRIVHLPPFTAACCHYIGKDPEDVTENRVTRFIQESRLYESKPDARMFGFNHPNPGILDGGLHGYEVWVTIPDGFPLPEGFTRRQFSGGLYAALTIRFGDFHHWFTLNRWAEESDEFEIDWRGDENTMGGCLEEHLNWVRSAHLGWPKDGTGGQIDLLLPIRQKAV